MSGFLSGGRSPGIIARGIWSAGGKRLLIALCALFILCVIFTRFDPSALFSGERNVMNLFRNTAPILLIGIGQSIVLITGNIDLSIGSVMGMSCMIASTLMSTWWMLPQPAVIIALSCCALVGLFNGEMVGRLRVPSYIATIGSLLVCRGVAQVVNGNYDTGYVGRILEGLSFREVFSYGRLLGAYTPIWIGFGIWAIFFFLMTKTRTGRYFYAIGSNPRAFRLSGVSVFSTIDKAYIISAVCAGVAGLMAAAESGYGDMETGSFFELYAVAAAVIGGISPIGGRGLMVGTLLGAAIWCVLQNGLIRLGLGLGIRNIIIGIIVILTVVLDVSRTKPLWKKG